jgi:hypothetical protein
MTSKGGDTMTDFQRYLLEEFVEDYEEGLLTRREALKLLAGVTELDYNADPGACDHLRSPRRPAPNN